jgi:hypothetical protein
VAKTANGSLVLSRTGTAAERPEYAARNSEKICTRAPPERLRRAFALLTKTHHGSLLATAVHTSAYLGVMGILAWVVYRKLGLALLRRAWFNFNMIWGTALVITGLFTLLV